MSANVSLDSLIPLLVFPESDAPWDELHLSVDDTAGRKLEKLQDPFGTNII